MHIWEEEKQSYIKACMERGTEEQKEALKKFSESLGEGNYEKHNNFFGKKK